MINREKVMKGLECCSALNTDDGLDRCEECPYNEISIFVHDCRAVLSADALELLKEQKHDDDCPCAMCGYDECVEVCDDYKKWVKMND